MSGGLHLLRSESATGDEVRPAYKRGILGSTTAIVYSYFKKSCPKKCARDNPEIARGNMGYDQYAVPSTVAVESLLLLFFSISKHMSIVRWPRGVTHAN